MKKLLLLTSLLFTPALADRAVRAGSRRHPEASQGSVDQLFGRSHRQALQRPEAGQYQHRQEPEPEVGMPPIHDGLRPTGMLPRPRRAASAVAAAVASPRRRSAICHGCCRLAPRHPCATDRERSNWRNGPRAVLRATRNTCCTSSQPPWRKTPGLRKRMKPLNEPCFSPPRGEKRHSRALSASRARVISPANPCAEGFPLPKSGRPSRSKRLPS